MSTERRWEKRRFQIEESTTQNGGKRTVFIEHMAPSTAVPPHFHLRFSETFDLLEGSLTVFRSSDPDLTTLEASRQDLRLRDPVTVEPGVYHRYVAGAEGPVALRVVLMPGDKDFERLLMILDGLARDGELGAFGDSMLLMAVIMGLSDAHLIGPAKTALDELKSAEGVEIERLRVRLLAKYDNEESLRNLLMSG